ncbi:glycoside hydrolase family 88 protein [Fulvivirgaceae bacterium PWU4]|uniref:Glycoside hydrolase family 88 protein n=1 Tax=Chryseosolibacter histidini TaxID=2782349 RepID=A0AAP2GS08_9BACT|nr:glycosyl hydrolase [Chryseosolibacter histidini]MBT1700192.1 glycoside hydrolase family 88 protein [Chryseosolibacter histidini]
MKIDAQVTPESLRQQIDQFWKVSGQKILAIEKNFDTKQGAPVFTVNGRYTTRGWTEWTQGFQYGSAILQFDATGDTQFLEIGRKNTVEKMAPHITHEGVHDHGFNNASTYGNLLRLIREGKVQADEWEKNFYELALKSSGAVQAMRWTPIKDGGYIYSFNGPHSLFVDTVRSCRIVMLSHALGHMLGGENDVKISLLERAVKHLIATARYSVFYGEGRDHYDISGRTAHECIFNINDGNYRCPNSQQGFSGFTTWTRGLAWAMCGFAEELEFLETISADELKPLIGKDELVKILLKAARATSDFYIRNTATDGIPYWDTGAPGLVNLGDYLNKTSDPYNEHEPVDSSAAAIAAQGLLRLGNYLQKKNDASAAQYTQAGLNVAKTLLTEPYLSTRTDHEGLLLHSVYHRPNGWDNIPKGRKVPCDESSMWGDYHVRELMLYILRLIKKEKYYTFFNCSR